MRSIRINSFLVMVCLAMAITAEADFRRDYSSGVRDYYNKDYSQAIISLENAIKDKAGSNAKERVRFYGMRYEPYMPYFFLGQARFKDNDCAGALSAWKKSVAGGVVQSKEEYTELLKNQAECEIELNKPPEALLTAVQAYFEGNFLKTAEVDPGAMKEKHAKVQAYLFRAASRFNLYLLSGKADPNLLEQSEDDIRSIKKLNTGFSPYNEGFSPEFRDLFSKTS